ncbi:MAG: tyrosine-type recombinase/integrase [Planctomycetota bacterium]|jgi:integrase
MRLPPPGDQEEFYEALLRACRRDRERASVMLLWRTGMHASTLVEQTFNITLEEGYVHWDRPKFHGKKTRHLRAAMPSNEITILRRCIKQGNLPSTQRALRYRLNRIACRAGYEGITPLTLRHSRAIYLLDEGMPSFRVAAMLGCSWRTLEKHYAQIEAARLVE